MQVPIKFFLPKNTWTLDQTSLGMSPTAYDIELIKSNICYDLISPSSLLSSPSSSSRRAYSIDSPDSLSLSIPISHLFSIPINTLLKPSPCSVFFIKDTPLEILASFSPCVINRISRNDEHVETLKLDHKSNPIKVSMSLKPFCTE